MKNEIQERDVVVVGGGVSGSTLGVYLARAGYKPMIITGGMIGGILNEIPMIDNYIGIPNISGEEISENLLTQLTQCGLDNRDIVEFNDVIEISKCFGGKMFEVLYKDSSNISKVLTRNVVIATGSKMNKLDSIGKDVQKHCVLCDGFMYKDGDVVVIGGGNSAYSEALELSKICKSVTIIQRRKEPRAESVLVDAFNKKENTKVIIGNVHSYNAESKELVVGQKSGLTSLVSDGVFVYIGSSPNTGFLGDDILLTENGNIIVDNNNIVTTDSNLNSKLGLYSVGDVTNSDYKQISTAIGDATKVAIQIINKLKLDK